jgi:glycosyltransferase involved in cell wall biosynthesis
LALSRLAGIVFGKSRLGTALEQLQPDVLHTQGLRADWLSSRLAGSYIKVATQRSNPLEDYPPLMGRLKGTIAARLHYHALTRLPVVVACSQTISGVNTRRGLPTKAIHNGVDLTLARPPLEQEKKTARRHALGLPETGRLFIFAGPLIPRKNPELLIRAMINRARQRDALLILGDGPLLPRCRRLAKNAPNIFLPGPVDSVADYLEVADLYFSASSAEGIPNAVLEALAAGLPALLSDIQPHQEILTLSSTAGWLFQAHNLEALLEQIEQIIVSPNNRHAARQLAAEHFSASGMSRAYQHLYQDLFSVRAATEEMRHRSAVKVR